MTPAKKVTDQVEMRRQRERSTTLECVTNHIEARLSTTGMSKYVVDRELRELYMSVFLAWLTLTEQHC